MQQVSGNELVEWYLTNPCISINNDLEWKLYLFDIQFNKYLTKIGLIYYLKGNIFIRLISIDIQNQKTILTGIEQNTQNISEIKKEGGGGNGVELQQ